MAERDLVVRFIGDDRSLNAAFTRQERRAKGFSASTATAFSGLSRGFAAAGITLGTAAVFKGLEDSVSAASDLNEQIAKSQQVFGQSSQVIEDWAQTTADAFGISQREALAAAGTFGNLFRTIDLAPEKAAEMSRALVELSADLASFNNASPEDVLVALRSGLIGEAEPLRRYGVLLSEARVQQVAMATTGKQTAKALTDQEKALARYQVIQQDTKIAQGDFARTSEGLANQSRKLRANIDDLQANMGGKLIPVALKATEALNLLLSPVEQLSRSGPLSLPVDTSDLPEAKRQLVELTEARAKLSRMGAGDPILRQITADIRTLHNAILELDPSARNVFDDLRASIEAVGAAADEATSSVRGLNPKEVEGRLRGMEEQEVLARIGGRQSAIVDALRARREFLERQLARDSVQRNTKLRRQLEDELLSVTEQIRGIEARARAEAASARAASRRAEQEDRRLAAEERRRAAERRRRDAENARNQDERNQFRRLGLTAEGEPRGPTVRNLRARRARLEDQIKGTTLDTTRTRNQLERIRRVLTGKFGEVGKDVRAAIKQMLDDIANALQGGSKRIDDAAGPLTKTTSLNSRKITEGLGLSQEEIRALRARLSNFNSAGIGLAGGQTSTTGGRFVGPGPVEVESHITINLDGKKVASVVTKAQQRGNRRNPRQKRGPNRITRPGI